MKIRDLDLDQYVIVYDIGKSEDAKGMTVVGKVIDYLEFIDEENNQVYINSNGNKYLITDDNYFDLWSNYLDNKTEHIGFDKENTEKARKLLSNDLQQRKRKNEDTALFKIKDLKVGYKVKVLGDNMIGEVSEIADNGKSAEIKVDDGVYRVIIDNYDFTIIEWNAVPEYAEDTVNHPSHYNYGEIEVIDFIEQVTQHYNPNVAYHIGNAIKYLARSPHKNGKEDVAKAKWYIERAYDNWDVK